MEGKCAQIEVHGGIVSLDGKEVYTRTNWRGGQQTVEYPAIFSPFFGNLIAPSDKEVRGEDEGRGNVRSDCTRASTISVSKASQRDFDMAEYSSVKTSIANKELYYKCKSGKLTIDEKTLVDYNDSKSPPLNSKEKRVVALLQPEPNFSLLKDYLNYFVAVLSGDYIIPHAYETGDAQLLTIVNRPMYGTVRLDTTDGRFYLQYTRNSMGVLTGEVTRTQLVPFHESAKEGETSGCFIDENGSRTPVYFSYYDPAGTGKQITREEYMKIKESIIYESVPMLPKELTGLLGF